MSDRVVLTFEKAHCTYYKAAFTFGCLFHFIWDKTLMLQLLKHNCGNILKRGYQSHWLWKLKTAFLRENNLYHGGRKQKNANNLIL